MNGKFLLDTNVVVALFNSEPQVLREFSDAEAVYVSPIVFGELYVGANKSHRVADNRKRIDEFASQVEIPPCDVSIARVYGLIKDELRTLGRPIPDNDAWIAATARLHQLTLVTRDAHFDHVPGLMKTCW